MTGQVTQKVISMPLGVVVRRVPGVTRWARFAWSAVAVLPGAPARDWHELRRDGEAVEYHVATVPLELHRADAEAYRTGLSATHPSIFVVLDRTGNAERGVAVRLVTASPYEAQDYADTGEELVEAVPMPPALAAWINDFTSAHFKEEKFVKRRRDKQKVDAVEAGVGDARIAKAADVYSAPGLRREARG